MNPQNVAKLDKAVKDIAEIRTDVKWLIKSAEEHKATHRSYNLKMFGAFLAALVAAAVACFR